MGKGRLEAFSDGVIAIIITIMVLELEVPHDVSFASLAPLLPVLLSYVLSFVYVGIYWNNHHHMLAACHRVSGAALWANLHLLFWLSLFPFTTAWMGENHFAAAPTAVYGGVLLMAALAYWLLQRILMRIEGHDSVLTRAMGSDWKGKLSPFFYIVGIVSTFWLPWIALGLYAAVAVLWLIPDRRIEGVLPGTRGGGGQGG
ncbi:MAG TPA: TMEM175 family protein [Luteimonas sp.]|nr:TMEM175 family protein [Luteimonas sp.]